MMQRGTCGTNSHYSNMQAGSYPPWHRKKRVRWNVWHSFPFPSKQAMQVGCGSLVYTLVLLLLAMFINENGPRVLYEILGWGREGTSEQPAQTSTHTRQSKEECAPNEKPVLPGTGETGEEMRQLGMFRKLSEHKKKSNLTSGGFLKQCGRRLYEI